MKTSIALGISKDYQKSNLKPIITIIGYRYMVNN